MALAKPLRRTCRQFPDATYSGSGRWIYVLHPQFAIEPQHYVQAFLLLQKDLLDLFAFIEPADENLKTYSHRVQQLLMRTCVEIEANCAAILTENGYRPEGGGHLDMRDYRRIERSHRLSQYRIRIPLWRGNNRIVRPFAAWEERDAGLDWYQAYNKSKHDRHECFERANFDEIGRASCRERVFKDV